MTTAAYIVIAVVVMTGVAVWLGLLIWAARADGRDQKAFEERAHEARSARRPWPR